MKRHYLARLFASLFLGLAVLFTVSVQEVHYLFTEHHTTGEVCDNHLHQADTHGPCAVCKFDVSLFTDEITAIITRVAVYMPQLPLQVYTGTPLLRRVSANGLRGPPAVA